MKNEIEPEEVDETSVVVFEFALSDDSAILLASESLNNDDDDDDDDVALSRE